MSASALPLKLCFKFYHQTISFQTSPEQANPSPLMIYKHLFLLHKVYNDKTKSHEWHSLFFNQTFNNKTLNANFIDNSNFQNGKNLIQNRFPLLNNKITNQMLNSSYDSYKVKCKTMYINNYN